MQPCVAYSASLERINLKNYISNILQHQISNIKTFKV